ncbi:G-patch-domain-containing protein [Gigaspora margarita]|uniref:G-patch-domain-containing protein n=1 Tax=Gigaspora margarita TaxID=4874 RepID=A0A8H4AZF0_GIGMA|nr:G-patch-domain-containing protein [Gigaspora margarita]
MGLAGPKVKQRIPVDPRNQKWSNDKTKYGYKMLSKMGWSPGKGLGLNENGSQDYVKLSHKLDNLGVGASKKTIDNWLDNSNAFDDLLKGLNQQTQGNVDVTEEVIQNNNNDSELNLDSSVKITHKKQKKKEKHEKNKNQVVKNKKKVKLDISKSKTSNESNSNTNNPDSTSIRLAHRAKYLKSKKAAVQDSERLNEILGIKTKPNVAKIESISDIENSFKINQDNFENVVNDQNSFNKNENDYYSGTSGFQTVVNKLSTQDYFLLKAKQMSLTESDKSDEQPCFNMNDLNLTKEGSVDLEFVTERNEERKTNDNLNNINCDLTHKNCKSLEGRRKRKVWHSWIVGPKMFVLFIIIKSA